MGADFVTGLVGSFGEKMLGEEERLHKEKLDRAKAKGETFKIILQNAKVGTPEGDRMIKLALEGLSGAQAEKGDVGLGEVFGRGKGKGKGKQQADPADDTLQKIMGMIGQVGGAGGQGSPGGEVEGVKATPPFVEPGLKERGGAPQPAAGQTQGAAPAAQKLSVPEMPGQATKQAGGPLAVPPIPEYTSPFKSAASDAEAKHKVEMKARGEDLEDFEKRYNAATTPEAKRAIESFYGIHNPLPHLQMKVMAHKSDPSVPVPVSYDPQTGQSHDEQGNVVTDLVPYQKPTPAADKREKLISAYMDVNPSVARKAAEKWADSQTVRQEEAKGAPTTSQSRTVESTPGGPAITRETTTVHTKGTPSTGLTPAGQPRLPGADKHSPLPLQWAVPKEGRTAIRKAQDKFEDTKSAYDLAMSTYEKIQKDPAAAAQGDVLILSAHIGQTLGQTKVRPTMAMWEQARTHRTWEEGIQVRTQGAFITGASLSPAQRKYMVELLGMKYREAQKTLLDEQVRYGVKVKVQGPDGGLFYLDKNKVPAYEKQGYKLVGP